ncbi:potassium channel family protein [Sphingomonas sp. G124]|uniref:Potassium channel family protein n=1 Tax=Sphingomonas cremea TaxID=2904799 RepID=A0A9X1QJC2_9SPHN|nr:potassium channel family protein [Sphingomonas cremea]MCF2514591.1 potassium channel family protein [Sphingomonas cremea]
MPDNHAPRTISTTKFWQAYGRRRYAILFYALLLMLVAEPVAASFNTPPIVIKLLVATCLLLAVLPNATKRSRRFLIGAILLLILVRLVSERDDVPIHFGIVLALFALTGLVAAGGTLRFAVTSPKVDGETIHAALSTYLLAGLFFGVLYSAIEFSWPGSFTGPDKFTDSSATYYSFVTLATLGYGDFLPRSELARGIATLEVIGGQLYLAVMVARLIAAFELVKKP